MKAFCVVLVVIIFGSAVESDDEAAAQLLYDDLKDIGAINSYRSVSRDEKIFESAEVVRDIASRFSKEDLTKRRKLPFTTSKFAPHLQFFLNKHRNFQQNLYH